MAKDLSETRLTERKNQAMQQADQFLSALIHSENPSDLKKASLLSYWISDYFRFLGKEPFLIPKNISNINVETLSKFI